MGIYALLKAKRLTPNGKEYVKKTVVSASKGYWIVEYQVSEPFGYSYEYGKELMSLEDQKASNCFCEDSL